MEDVRWKIVFMVYLGMKLILIIAGIGIAIYDALLFLMPVKGNDINFIFNLAYSGVFIIGAIAALIDIKKFSGTPDLKRSMLFYAMGMAFYALGLFVWTYYNLVLRVDIPYPSLADAAFLIYYPGVILGTYFLLKSFGGLLTRKLIVEGLLVMVALFITLYLFLNQTSLGPDVTYGARILNILYPFADSFLVALAITILRTEKGISEHPNILYFVFSFIILAIADTVFSFRQAAGVYWNGDISDLLFAVSGFLTSWGILSVK